MLNETKKWNVFLNKIVDATKFKKNIPLQGNLSILKGRYFPGSYVNVSSIYSIDSFKENFKRDFYYDLSELDYAEKLIKNCFRNDLQEKNLGINYFNGTRFSISPKEKEYNFAPEILKDFQSILENLRENSLKIPVYEKMKIIEKLGLEGVLSSKNPFEVSELFNALQNYSQNNQD